MLAAPAAAAAGLLAPLPGAAEAATLLAGVEYASVAIVVLAFPLAHLGRPLDRSGFLVPRVEGTALTACSWSSTKWAHLAPDAADGTAVVRASTGRWGDDGRAVPRRRRPRRPPPDRPRADDGDHRARRRRCGSTGGPRRSPSTRRATSTGSTPSSGRSPTASRWPGPPCGVWVCRRASGAGARPRPACSRRKRRPDEPRSGGSGPHHRARARRGSAAGRLAPPVGVLAARLPRSGPARPAHRRSPGRVALRPRLGRRLRTARPDDVLDAGPHRARLRRRGRVLRRRHRRRDRAVPARGGPPPRPARCMAAGRGVPRRVALRWGADVDPGGRAGGRTAGLDRPSRRHAPHRRGHRHHRGGG